MRVKGGGCLAPIILGVFWCIEKAVDFIIRKIEHKSEKFIRNINFFLIIVILCELIFFIKLFIR